LPLNAAPVHNYQLTNNDTTASNSFSYKLKTAVSLGTAQLSLLVHSSSDLSLLASVGVLTSQQMGYKQ
jgi:hypothetical protein